MALVFGLPVLFGSIGTFLVANSYAEEEDDMPKAPEPTIFETIFPSKPEKAEKAEPSVFESVFSSNTEPAPAKPGMLESVFSSTPEVEPLPEVPSKPGMMESMFSTTPKVPEPVAPVAPLEPAKSGMFETMFSTTPKAPEPLAPPPPQLPHYEPIQQPGIVSRGVNSLVDFSKSVQDKARIRAEKKRAEEFERLNGLCRTTYTAFYDKLISNRKKYEKMMNTDEGVNKIAKELEYDHSDETVLVAPLTRAKTNYITTSCFPGYNKSDWDNVGYICSLLLKIALLNNTDSNLLVGWNLDNAVNEYAKNVLNPKQNPNQNAKSKAEVDRFLEAITKLQSPTDIKPNIEIEKEKVDEVSEPVPEPVPVEVVVPEVPKPSGVELGAIQARKDIEAAKKFKLPIAHSPPVEDHAEALLNDDLGLPLEPLKDMDLEDKQWGNVQVKPRGPRTRRNAFGQLKSKTVPFVERDVIAEQNAALEAHRLAQQALEEAAVTDSKQLIESQEQAAEAERLAQESAVEESKRLIEQQAQSAEAERVAREAEAETKPVKARRPSFEDLAKATKAKFDREEAERIKNQAIVAEGLRKAKELEESNNAKSAWDKPALPIHEYLAKKPQSAGRKTRGRNLRSTR